MRCARAILAPISDTCALVRGSFVCRMHTCGARVAVVSYNWSHVTVVTYIITSCCLINHKLQSSRMPWNTVLYLLSLAPPSHPPLQTLTCSRHAFSQWNFVYYIYENIFPFFCSLVMCFFLYCVCDIDISSLFFSLFCFYGKSWSIMCH